MYTSAVRSVAEMGKTLGVLVGLWAILGLIGWAAGAFPVGTGTTADRDDAGLEVADAGASGDAGHEEPADAWTEEPDAPSGPLVEALPVVAACEAPAEVVWALGELVGGGDDEIVLACASAIEVLAWAPGGAAPVRVARATLRTGTQVRDIAIGDVDGDGRPDLVVSLDDGLYLIPRDASGGFAPARTLAPGRNGALVLAPLDADPGLDLAVVHGADPRPELWLYRGGSAPVRSATVPAPVSTSALASLDLDVDGHLDVIAIGSQQILIAFGDSRASVARSRSLTPGGRGGAVLAAVEPAALVIDSDAAPCLLAPAPEMGDSSACTSVSTLEPSVRQLRAGETALLGVRHPDVVAWTPAGTTVVASLATTSFGAHRVGLVGDALVILGSAARAEGGRELQLVRAPRGTTFREGERVEVIDAPLVLTIALPDPDAP